ncbi:hypothetical protein NMG60_11012235 [Bertholletia excelsa]
MASSFTLKRFVSSTLLPSCFRTARPAVPVARLASRSFKTNVAPDFDGNNERNLDVDRPSSRSLCRGDWCFNADVFDPFSRTGILSHILNLNGFMDSLFTAASRRFGTGHRRGWDARDTDDGLYLRMDMPGLGKEHVMVSVEQNTLIIEGEAEKESDEEESGQRYTSRIALPEKIYKIDQIKAEMKNGVLKVVVPKVKEEERDDVVHVKVE